MKLVAYHNDPALKAECLAKMAAHRKADTLVKGVYWEGGKGCAVGCLIASDDHGLYETEFGIPQALAQLEDCFFENLPNDQTMLWPERFLGAIHVGADLNRVVLKFLHWNLTENLILEDRNNAYTQAFIVKCRTAITQCADALIRPTNGFSLDESAESAARSAARSVMPVADSAAWASSWASSWSAARYAAESAEYAAKYAAWSAESAESAEYAARYAARYAAWSAKSAAKSAVWSTDPAAWSAESASRYAAWFRMSDKLIELLAAKTCC